MLSALLPSPSRSVSATARRWAWVVWVVLAVPGLVAYFVAPGVDRALQYDLFGVLAVCGMLAGTVLHESETKRWWRVAALGIGLYVLGDAIYTVLDAAGTAPFPSVADAAYLSGSVVFVIAVTRLVEPDMRGILRPALLDAAIVAISVGTLAWRAIIQPVTSTATDPFSAIVAMSYPALDVLLLFVLLRHLLARSRKSTALWLLATGVLSFLVADLVYTSLSINGTYESGMLVDAGWLIGYVLFAAAALHPSMRQLAVNDEVVDPISNRRIALLVIVISIGACVIALSPVETPSQVIGTAIAAAALVSLSLVRFVGSLVETRTLLFEATHLRDTMVTAARTDALTGLPNRVAFMETVRLALAQRGTRIALLFLDLDEFKAVNDTLGHEVGDELLVAVARRLRQAVRSGDVVARFGGDEFGVLILSTASQDDPTTLADRILGQLDLPFALAEATVTIHASIGIAMGGSSDDEVGLLRHADIAMYDAKRQGGRRWRLFEQAHERIVERYRLATELEQAIQKGELVVHYQPICELESGESVALEALVRWQHPDRGLLAPGDFIPVAGSAGLVGLIDLWVLRTSLRQVRAWIDAGLWTPTRRMHVNFDPTDLEDPAIVEQIASALRDAGVPASVLSVEVTESGLLDVDRTRRHLEQIASLGVTLSLDDFGTRYAVLATLADLPFTTLKIDQSFVLQLEVPSRARLFEGIVRLAERLGLQTLAEGIETEAQRIVTRDLGCRLGQGYLLGQPVPAAAIEAALLPRHSRGSGLVVLDGGQGQAAATAGIPNIAAGS